MNEKKLNILAAEICLETLKVIHKWDFDHVDDSIDLADLMAVLYGEVMKYDSQNPRWEGRDWLVLSNWYASPTACAALGLMGFFPMEEAYTLNRLDTKFSSKADRRPPPGMDAAKGPHGQGAFSAACTALGNRVSRFDSYVYCIIDNRETKGSQVWEAFCFAHTHALDNLIFFIGNSGYPLDEAAADTWDCGGLAKKAAGFGFHTQVIDGHDVKAIYNAIILAKSTKGVPSCIILTTSKGAAFAEVKNRHFSPLEEDQ